MTAEFSFLSAVRGHHVYKSTWQPIIGEQLHIDREVGNPRDHFAVAVFKTCPNSGTRTIVGHVPREISCLLTHFLNHGGEIRCEVTDRRRRSPLVQGGLEVPCSLTLSGKKQLVLKAKVLITNKLLKIVYCIFVSGFVL